MMDKNHQNDEKRSKLMENNSERHQTQCAVATDTFWMPISSFIFHDILDSDSVPESPGNMLGNTFTNVLLMFYRYIHVTLI